MDSAATLSIAVRTLHPVGLVAARHLARAWRSTGGNRIRLAAGPGATGPWVALSLGSLVRPSVVVRFRVPFEGGVALEAERLALTAAAWDSLFDFEPWRALAAPLVGLPRWGRVDVSRPWALVEGSADTGLGDGVEPHLQLHVIGGWRMASRDGVWWPASSRIAAALIGRADRVIGNSGALVFDSVRTGLRARTGLADSQGLAGLVVPSLLGDVGLWEHVAGVARRIHASGAPAEPLMTRDWVERGRQNLRLRLAAPAPPWEKVRRRYDKLWREPRRFFADSKHPTIRWLGRTLER